MAALGLTGSIGAGKSHALRLFAKHGARTHSADAIVHGLYENEAFDPVAELFPTCVKEGKLDRQCMASAIYADASLKAKLEAIVHPLVRQKAAEFIAGGGVAVLEIPLLFESGIEHYRPLGLTHTAVVDAPLHIRRERALARDAHLSENRFHAINASQMPAEEKKRLADFVLENHPESDLEAQVRAVMQRLQAAS